MSDMGVEASAATAMVGQSESCAMLPRNSLIVNIDSPFSFALTLVVNGTDIPLFLGIVENRDDLILE
jgi:serine protease inhibitor